MFTGIIETTAVLKQIIPDGANLTFWLQSSISKELKIDQSVSHDGVCLTVEDIRDDEHRVTAIAETLDKTVLDCWKPGTIINLERCLPVNGRLDGHFVQGHVDCRAVCRKKTGKDGSWEFEFRFPKKFAELVIEKGSVCINGISLTAFKVKKSSFRVAIIPYTFAHTNMQNMQEGDSANLEFDLMGKYLLRRLSLKKK